MPSSVEIQFEEACRSFEATRARTRELRQNAGDLGRQVCEARAALAGAVEASVRILGSVRISCVAGRGEAVVELECAGQSALLKALAAAGLDACSDLDDLTDDVIAAYRDAVAHDDDRLVTVLGGMLREIGRHLAERVGPRAAGALSS